MVTAPGDRSAARSLYSNGERPVPPLELPPSVLRIRRDFARRGCGEQARLRRAKQTARVDWLASLVIRAPWRTLGVVGGLALVAAALGLSTPGRLGRASNEFVAAGSESLRAEAVVERASGLSAGPQVLVLVS